MGADRKVLFDNAVEVAGETGVRVGTTVTKVMLPPDLPQDVFDEACRLINEWEDQGEHSADLAIDLYHLFTGKPRPIIDGEVSRGASP